MTVNEDIEAQKLETVGALGRTENFCRIADLTFATDDRLNDAVLNLCEEKLIVVTHQPQSFPKSADAPLRPLVILGRICVVLEV